MATFITDIKTLPERKTPIPGAKPPVHALPYKDTGSPEEADTFRTYIRSLRNQSILPKQLK
jgi:hypothetical protein